MGPWRTLSVALVANTTGFTGPMGKAGLVAKGFGLAVVAGLIAASSAAAEFEQRMSAVSAVSGATGGQLDALRSKALQLGADTVFSASEVAGAIEELVKAGLTVEQVLGGAADATVALAAAGGVALEEAATLAATSMNTFRLTAEDMPRVADIIAGAANVSAADVSQMGQSFQMASAVAAQVGLSFEDTAVAIGMMADSGIAGSDAGTALKTMLSRLTPQTAKQASAMKELGLLTEAGTSAFFDQNGELKSLEQVAGLLQGAFQGLTKEQQLSQMYTVFGSDAIRAASVIMREGAGGAREFAAAMGEITAEEVAAERLNNLRGDVEQLKGSIETLLIEGGTPLNVWLRELAQSGTAAVNWLNDPPEEFTDWVRDTASAVGTTLLPVWNDLVDTGENLWEIVVKAADGLQPLGEALGALAAGGAVVALKTLAQALSVTSGLLAGQEGLIRTVAIGYGVHLVGGLVASTAKWWSAQRAAMAFNLQCLLGEVRARGLSRVLGSLTSGYGGLAATVGIALFATAAYNAFTASQRAEEAARKMFDTMEDGADLSTVAGLRDLISDVRSEVDDSEASLRNYEGFWGRLRGVGEGLGATLTSVIPIGADMTDGLTKANATVEEGEDRLDGYGNAVDRLREAMTVGKLTAGELATALSDADIRPDEASVAEWLAFLDSLKEGRDAALHDASGGAAQYAENIQIIADEASSAEEQVEALKDVLESMFNPQLDVWNATTKYREALQEMQANFAWNGATTDADTESGRDVRNAVAGAISDAMDLADAIATQTGNVDQGKQAMSLFAAEIRKAATDAGWSEAEVRGLAQELGLLPEDIDILLGVTDEATPELETAATRFDEIRSRFSEPLNVEMPRAAIDGFAEGVTSLTGMAQVSRMATDRLADSLTGLEATPGKVTIDDEEFYPTAGQIETWIDWYGNASPEAEALLNTGGAQLGFTDLATWAAFYESLDPETQASLNENPAAIDFNVLFGRAEEWRQSNPETTAHANTTDAEWALAHLARTRDATVNVDFSVRGQGVVIGGGVTLANTGGRIYGPNVDRDVVPAMLTPDEHVITQKKARLWGHDFFDAINSGQIMPADFMAMAHGQLPGFNAGGSVGINGTWGSGMLNTWALGRVGPEVLAKAKDEATAWMNDHFAEAYSTMAPPGGGGANAAQARAWIIQALGILGLPMTWLEPAMRRANQESGYNPHAINLWDSNARKGVPSKGLFQTIDPTFNAYKLPGFGDIWNGLHNSLAAFRYMIARYGSVFNLPSGGYNLGGHVEGPGYRASDVFAHAEPWDTPGALHAAPPGLNTFYNGTGRMEHFRAEPLPQMAADANRALQVSVKVENHTHVYLGNEKIGSYVDGRAQAVSETLLDEAYRAETRIARAGQRHGW